MPPTVAAEVFSHLSENEKPLYKAAIDTLAKQRKLRPVYVERKPREERHAWMREVIGRKANEDVAGHVLQIWLVGKHAKLLCDFLDSLDIKHDENGTVNEMPPSPSRAALEAAVDTLLQKYDRETVTIYLHSFQAVDEKGWPELEAILAQDERLRL